MKKIMSSLAVAGLGAAIAVGSLVGAGSANANTGSFINAANNEGWYDVNTGGTLRLGYGVCNMLNAGYSESSAMNWVYYNTNYSVSVADAGQFVSMAEDYLC